MAQRLVLETKSRAQLVDITSSVQDIVSGSRINDGICVVQALHTTAAITINENADPDVVVDLIEHLGALVPENGNYRHHEGNSDAHIKASLLGFSENIIIENRRLVLGTWQAIYFCEFDGPRNRLVAVRLIADQSWSRNKG